MMLIISRFSDDSQFQSVRLKSIRPVDVVVEAKDETEIDISSELISHSKKTVLVRRRMGGSTPFPDPHRRYRSMLRMRAT